MSQQHPITPPPELVQQWRNGGPSYAIANNAYEHYIAAQAAQWGADMELRACCDTLQRHAHWDLAVFELMDDRRPKPPSLKEQALQALDRMHQLPTLEDSFIIRRALEALND